MHIMYNESDQCQVGGANGGRGLLLPFQTLLSALRGPILSSCLQLQVLISGLFPLTESLTETF